MWGWGSRGAQGCVVGLTGTQERAGRVEREVPGVPGKSCSHKHRRSIAHTESKAISDFVQTIISVLLFDEERGSALEQSPHLWETGKLKHVFRPCLYSTSNPVWKPRTRQKGRQWQDSPMWETFRQNLHGDPRLTTRCRLGWWYTWKMVRTQTHLCVSHLLLFVFPNSISIRLLLLSVSDFYSTHPPPLVCFIMN